VVFFTASAVLGHDFTKKIDKFIGFAPVIYIGHMNTGLQILFDNIGLLDNID
jgi:hypothetical protein